ncbi:hypothetical protein [Chryseobacterium koreense]|uniref:Uncharacterized protein n=1 Tax=Chryseobacterium koreense CCUG 49689 TaxID=1304281 RepID=A0A0J7ITD4_9FLAO|nr:hypothetical protein [Chryseobacterium koreense]KMQ69483.1 hypothetical protein ACM44_14515 [Chryseobacterium koreense CCUG 49689]MBB5334673.1 hypothetical protein [Chryseobacterium koreense]
MKTKLLLIFFLACSISGFSQSYIFGKVKSELGNEIFETIIINTRTDEKVLSDKDGNFMIAAKPSDELRFVKSGYDRFDVRISNENFSKPLDVHLKRVPYLIPEVEIAFQPTGNLKKDSKTLDPPKKVVALNSSLNAYMMTPPSEVGPKLTTPSAFQGQDYSAGHANILGIAKAIFGLVKKKANPLTTANYAETQQFFARIKLELDLSFYTSQGWDEDEIDRFLIYADQTYQLAKKYRNHFNISKISTEMMLAYKEYVKTRKTKS